MVKKYWIAGYIGSAAALLLALAVRLHGLGAQSLWFDEGWSAYAALQPTITGAANADATNPPLYYALLHVGARWFGSSEFSLRFVSLLFSMAALAGASRLARLLGGRAAGRWALWMGALLPALWWGAQEARMYSLMAALLVLAAWAWHRLRTRPTVWAWLGLWGAELALLYAHNTGGVVAIWLNIVTLISWLLARHPRHYSSFASAPQFAQRNQMAAQIVPAPLRPNWRVWTAGQLIVGGLWLPYFAARFLALGDANSALAAAPALTPEFALQVWASMWITPWERILRGTLTAWEGVLLALAALMVALALRRAAGRWLALHGALLTGGIIAGLLILGNEYHGRYIVMIAPLVGVALALVRPPAARWGALALCAALLAGSIAARPLYPNDDARSAAAEYGRRLGATSTVLMWSYADRYEFAYYWERLDVAAQRVTLPEGADMDAVLPLLPEPGGDIALNIWYTQRADYRGMMNCLLSAGTRPPAAFQVYGMDSLIYSAPPLTAPRFAPLDIQFSDAHGAAARLEAAGRLPMTRANHAGCLPLRLRTLRPLSADLKALILVHDESGRELARADAIFADAAQRTTSLLSAANAPVTAFATLRLPEGTPPGRYDVFVRLYDETDNFSGYVPDAPTRRAGRDVPLGTWEIIPGAVWLPDLPDDAPLRLLEASLSGSVVNNGASLDLLLLWSGNGALPALSLTLPDGRTRQIPTDIEQHDDLTRDYRALRIPADAQSGDAVVTLPDETIVARLRVEALPIQLDPPPFAQQAEAMFPGVGALIGFSYDAEALSAVLVWRAEAAAALAYTVFVQVVDEAGQVVAQSDSLHAGGARPTTGWRRGEYIEDAHILRRSGAIPQGETRLIAGLYDAQTGARARLADGSDYVVLTE